MDQALKIHIKGLEVFAHHGLLPEERKLGQPFVFDIIISLSPTKAAESDDITDTVDYAQVCDLVVETATAGSFNLLERLAAVTAESILDRFSAVEQVKLRVTKTSPPISHPVEGVAVSLKRKRAPGRS